MYTVIWYDGAESLVPVKQVACDYYAAMSLVQILEKAGKFLKIERPAMTSSTHFGIAKNKYEYWLSPNDNWEEKVAQP